MKITNLILGYLFILFSIIPFIRKDFWFFRIFEYPRFQKLIISCILLVFFLVFFNDNLLSDYIFIGLSVINIIYLTWLVYPFTRISKKQIQSQKEVNRDKSIRILIFNVLQYNKDYQSILTQIKKCDPDVICMVETDDVWLNEVRKDLQPKYPHTILSPLDNTYGMIFFSRFKLEDEEVCFIVKDDIPSISTKVILKDGSKVQLYCVHPEPPVPNENPRSTARDKELLIVGEKALKQNLPVIVMGDLNDVAWSYTTELFCKISQLLDPRKGRGFFSTFNAKNYLLRFPLDHVFCSREFAVVKIKRLPYSGSDHFPMFIELQLAEEKKMENKPEEVDEEDKKLAKEKIQKAV